MSDKPIFLNISARNPIDTQTHIVDRYRLDKHENINFQKHACLESTAIVSQLIPEPLTK